MSNRALTPAFKLIFDFRGILVRVANRLGVHPSFVSRVARGKRKSELIEAGLRTEIHKILDSIGVSIKDETKFWRQ